MPVGHKDPCPCGSGKKYKHCHMKKDLEKHQHGGWILVGTVVVLGVAVIYFANSGGLPWGGDRARTPASSSLPLTTGALPMTGTIPGTDTTSAPGTPGTAAATSAASQDQSPLPGGATPQPWQYDAPRNRFWYPDHGHWHDGAPPDPSQRATATAAQTTTPAVDQSPLPDGITPTPNYYDGAKNRHWVAEHSHWHSGRPPAAATGTTGTTTTAPATPTPQPTPAQPEPTPEPTPTP
jgi:hypothetical protein